LVGPTVVLDPGHGAEDSGAAANGIVEKESNLDLALRVEELLLAEGLHVILTRRDDTAAASPAGTDPAPGFFGRESRRDAQARVDIANQAQALVFVSIHSNGALDPGLRGVEVYYSSAHELAARNERLAAELLRHVLVELDAVGGATADRGVRADSCLYSFRGICRGIFVISPPRVTTREDLLRGGRDPERFGFPIGVDEVRTRATLMPSALVELLFISSPDDAAMLRDEAVRDALARGAAAGILAFLAEEAGAPE
jgi:N-acetylmuramoyl-L-alanine amidase